MSSLSATTNPPQSDLVDARQTYVDRLRRHQDEVNTLDRIDDRIAIFRLALGVAFAGCVGLRLLGWQEGTLGACVAVVAFVIVTMHHSQIAESVDRTRRLVAYYQAGLRRIDGGWEGRGVDGQRFIDPTHVYTGDLDIFGTGSLFELLCTVRTRGGEEALASMLSTHCDAQTARRRQRAAQEMAPRVDLREELALLGRDVRSRIRPAGLAAWGNHPPLLTSQPIRWAAIVITATNVITAIGWLEQVIPYTWFVISFIAGRILERLINAQLAEVVTAIKKTSQEFDLVARMLARVEKEEFASQELVALKDELARDGNLASTRLSRLSLLTAYLDALSNQAFVLFVPLLLWTTHCAYAIEGWREKNGSDVERWIDVIGRVEAFAAVGGFAYEHADYRYPEIVEDGDVYFEAVSLGHPLIPAGKVIKNDIAITFDKRLYIVSGSNMSGKSTLMRTIGVNAVLAMAGAPVCAERLTIQPRAIGTSITTNDSLAGGVSRFYAEIKRLHQIVTLARSTPTLFLLDEILHGTNSHDRRIGAEAILRTLSTSGAVGLATTHDLAISRIAEDDKLAAVNVHFEDQLVDGRMSFDYQLRQGIVEKSNALALMRAVGLEV